MKDKSRSIIKIEKIIKNIDDGQFNSSDIEVLFVTARELPNASKKIFDIGSFVAHSNARDKGYIKNILLRNHLRLNFGFGCDKLKIKPSLNQYPKYLPQLVELQLMTFDKNTLMNKVGLDKNQFNTSIKALTNKNSYEIKNGTCYLTEKIDDNEIKIINEVLSVLNCADGIDFNTLIIELKELLTKNGSDCDLNILDKNKKAIFCCLICLINGATYDLIDNIKTKLLIHTDEFHRIQVCGTYTIRVNIFPGDVVNIASPVFLSNYLHVDIFDSLVKRVHILENKIKYSTKRNKIIIDP